MHNTNVIDLSVDEDDTSSTVYNPEVKKHKVYKSPTIADVLATQCKINHEIRVKVRQNSQIVFTPPKKEGMAGLGLDMCLTQ